MQKGALCESWLCLEHWNYRQPDSWPPQQPTTFFRSFKHEPPAALPSPCLILVNPLDFLQPPTLAALGEAGQAARRDESSSEQRRPKLARRLVALVHHHVRLNVHELAPNSKGHTRL